MQHVRGDMPHDACYHSVKARYAVFPSARASQAIAKCRKASGHTRKTKAGASLKRWTKEKWVNTATGRPCGNSTDKTEYCRPSKRVSSATPVTAHAAGKAAVRSNYRRKVAGARARTLRRR